MKSSLVTAVIAASLAWGIAACGDSAGAGGAGAANAGGNGGEPGTGGEAGAGGEPATGGMPAAGGGGEGQGGEAEASAQLTVDPATMAAGDTITATIAVTNFILEAPTGQPNEDGHGHYHVYLDGATGGNYLVNGQTPSKQITIPANTSAGAHTLRLSLSDHAHVPLSPPVEHIIDITVTE